MKMMPSCFNEHCIKEHDWGKFPCTYNNCIFDSYSQHCFKLHLKSHTYQQKGKAAQNVTCARENCRKTFTNDFLLQIHLQRRDINSATYFIWSNGPENGSSDSNFFKSSNVILWNKENFGWQTTSWAECFQRFFWNTNGHYDWK